MIKYSKERDFWRLIICFACVILLFSCEDKPGYYTAADFSKVTKTDIHFHYNTADIRCLKYADSLNFKLISPNVDTEIPVDEQLKITTLIKRQYPENFAFFGTFSVDSFGRPGFADSTIARIDKCMKAGACGIKIWKNIGMVLKDSVGHFVMVDDQKFKPIFNYLEQNNIPLLAHLGEPKNCWLPVDEMTVDNDRRYYKNHTQYHMYLHPEEPSYEDQINARDNLLKNHPKLIFIGAHLASLEWNVDELGKRFDQFPNMKVDLAARIVHLQYQSLTNRDQVRNFLIKYQDRILYGSDMSINEHDNNYSMINAGLRSIWFDHWAYLATDSMFIVKDLGDQKVKGLQLPREVMDKIFCKNAEWLLGNGKQ